MKMPLINYWGIVLTFIILNFTVSHQQESENILYEFYPCEGSKAIVETFINSNPPNYNVTIKTSTLDFLPKRFELDLKFDFDAILKTHNDWLSFYDDSLSFNGITILEKPINVIITVYPKNGKKLPNIINVAVNKQSVCKTELYTDIWDKYVDIGELNTIPNIFPVLPPISEVVSKPTNLSTCGRRIIQNEGFITNGHTAKPGNWPWHTALYRYSINGEQSYICGATLISKTRVLTAGHCVVEYGSILLPDRLITVFGKFNFLGDNINIQEKKVFEIVLHPDFSHSTLLNDIAILKLSSEVKYTDFVQPICLWTEIGSIYTNGYVTGWGASEIGGHSETLIETQLPIVQDIVCIKSHAIFFIKLQTDGMYCAGFKNGTNVCNGDSGSGMYLNKVIDGNEVWFIKGIVSLGIPKKYESRCEPKHYSLFTDIPHYLSFIKNNLL